LIASGAQLGPYEITGSIGAGGMGEVFRARDSRIGRDVAIKVLPTSFASDPDRLRRFELEARTAGTLNHPNLVTIHDVGTFEGNPYLVMELLEGESLRDRIGDSMDSPTPASRIPVRKAIDYSVQLASGLAAAHEKAIIHRDLKPENIFITKDGRLKILDFGLAKVESTSKDDRTDLRTQQKDTSPGTILGTVGYMSPEQVRGRQVDHRTDIFSFGTILYELLSGQRAFRRDSSVETMNAILHDDPPELTSSPQHIPPAIDRIIRRCLEKDREQRFESARDLAFAIEAISSSGTTTETAAVTRPQRRGLSSSIVAIVLVALAAAGLASLAGYRAGRHGSSLPPAAFSQITFDAGAERQPALSPDGKTFAFVKLVAGHDDIFVQRVDGRSAIDLTRDSPGDDSQPAFSPDGNQIAFRSERDGGGIFVMGATGESVRRLTESGYNPAWSPDGSRIVYASEPVIDPRGRSSVSSLSVVNVASGSPRTLFKGDAMQPSWSPHGYRIAYWAIDLAGRRDLYTIDATGDPKTAAPVTKDAPLDWNPVWSPDGQYLYFSSDRDGTMNLWRIAVDEKTGTPKGAPEALRAPSPWAGYISIARTGQQITYQSTAETGELLGLSIKPETGTLEMPAAPLFGGSMLIRTLSLSPDGKWIAFTTQARQEDVFIMAADGSGIRQLTNDPARDRGVSWWPDSSRIVFYSNRNGNYEVWSIRPDGSALTQLTNQKGYGANYPQVSPDGLRIAYFDLGAGPLIANVNPNTPAVRSDTLPPLTGEPSAFFPQSWSPDGKFLSGKPWIASNHLYVYSFEQKRYRRLPAEVALSTWLDSNRIMFFESSGSRIGIADLSTGQAHIIGIFDKAATLGAHDRNSDALSFSRNGQSALVYENHSEGDIWQMILGEPVRRDASN